MNTSINYEEEFDSQIDTPISSTYPVVVGNLKKNEYVIINDHPCKISSVFISKPGKHGHTKAVIVGYDIFNSKRYESCYPTSYTIYAPVLAIEEYQLMAIDEDGYLTLMNKNGKCKSDFKLSNENDDHILFSKISEAFNNGKYVDITILSSMGFEKVLEFREN